MTASERFLGVVLIATLSFTGVVLAQDEQCLRQIGERALSFTVYQAASGSMKYCEDLPRTGKTTLTVDLMDWEFRSMAIGAKLLEAESWPNAQDESADAQARVVAQLPPQPHPQGVLLIEQDFSKPGYYVELVSVTTPDGKQHTLRFPFRVGVGLDLEWPDLWTSLGILALIVTGLGLWLYKRHFGQATQV
ncbi:MAG: hypothetical protein ACREWG_04690 [Gammaproteobacteria bacterium]